MFTLNVLTFKFNVLMFTFNVHMFTVDAHMFTVDVHMFTVDAHMFTFDAHNIPSLRPRVQNVFIHDHMQRSWTSSVDKFRHNEHVMTHHNTWY